MSRVFVPPLDWFLADKIAGWTAAGASIACSLPCCGGRSLERFDPDEDEVPHNMTALAHFAYYVLDADPLDRPSVFRQEVRKAVAPMALLDSTDLKIPNVSSPAGRSSEVVIRMPVQRSTNETPTELRALENWVGRRMNLR